MQQERDQQRRDRFASASQEAGCAKAAAWLLCLVGLAAAPGLMAQQAPGDLMSATAEQRPMYELPTLTIVAMSDIGPLSDRARSHYERGEWIEAAEVYRTAAESMPHNDPNSYTTFDMAARLFFYGDEFGPSREMMERAAGVAEATGDIVAAAYRHVDAAFISVWEGYPGKRREHVAAARQHAGKTGFDADDAMRIHALINGVSALPGDDVESSDN